MQVDDGFALFRRRALASSAAGGPRAAPYADESGGDEARGPPHVFAPLGRKTRRQRRRAQAAGAEKRVFNADHQWEIIIRQAAQAPAGDDQSAADSTADAQEYAEERAGRVGRNISLLFVSARKTWVYLQVSTALDQFWKSLISRQTSLCSEGNQQAEKPARQHVGVSSDEMFLHRHGW